MALYTKPTRVNLAPDWNRDSKDLAFVYCPSCNNEIVGKLAKQQTCPICECEIIKKDGFFFVPPSYPYDYNIRPYDWRKERGLYLDQRNFDNPRVIELYRGEYDDLPSDQRSLVDRIAPPIGEVGSKGLNADYVSAVFTYLSYARIKTRDKSILPLPKFIIFNGAPFAVIRRQVFIVKRHKTSVLLIVKIGAKDTACADFGICGEVGQEHTQLAKSSEVSSFVQIVHRRFSFINILNMHFQFAVKRRFSLKCTNEKVLPKLHSAEPGGSRCGAQRQPGGGNSSAVFAVKFIESDRWRGSQRPLSDGNGHTAVYSGHPAVVAIGPI